VCQAVFSNERTKGLIGAGTWHTIGERNLTGIINEEFGFRPDMVEERAKLYALSKIAQESILRYYSSMSSKVFGVIRMGTVLGESMPEKTAANIFIDRGLKGFSITPYKQSMYRPMLYVDIADICRAYQVYVEKILSAPIGNSSSLSTIINVYHPEPITIIDLAKIVQEQIASKTNGTVNPKIDVVDSGQPMMFNENDKTNIRVDISKAKQFLGWNNLISPRESLATIIDGRLKGQ
jgi:UDP-glucose 4-epimerase